jgi:hypothetical protein
VLEAAKIDGIALAFASEELRADRELVLEVMETDLVFLLLASDELKNDPELIAIAKSE